MKKKNKKTVFEFYNRESPEAIEMKRVFAHLTNSSLNNGVNLKSIAITSSTLGEGKSTLASLLAMTIADSNDWNVLLVDADFRRPMIHELFSLDSTRGFSNVLGGHSADDTILRSSPMPDLKVITVGRSVSNPTALLERTKLRAFFDEMKQIFDFIILDCPPVIPVSDMMDIAPEVDGTMLVIKAGQTPREVTGRAANLLGNYGANVIGIILNDTDRVLPYYYDYSYYRYQPTQRSNKRGKGLKSKEERPVKARSAGTVQTP